MAQIGGAQVLCRECYAFVLRGLVVLGVGMDAGPAAVGERPGVCRQLGEGSSARARAAIPNISARDTMPIPRRTSSRVGGCSICLPCATSLRAAQDAHGRGGYARPWTATPRNLCGRPG
jgi:hypothetical protein